MTAVAAGLTGTVTEAHAVLHVAMELPAPQHTAVEAAITGLGDALEIYGALDSRALHWSWVFPELTDEPNPDEGQDAALRKAAGEAEAATEDLIRVMAAHRGTEDEMKSTAGVTA